MRRISGIGTRGYLDIRISATRIFSRCPQDWSRLSESLLRLRHPHDRPPIVLTPIDPIRVYRDIARPERGARVVKHLRLGGADDQTEYLLRADEHVRDALRVDGDPADGGLRGNARHADVPDLSAEREPRGRAPIRVIVQHRDAGGGGLAGEDDHRGGAALGADDDAARAGAAFVVITREEGGVAKDDVRKAPITREILVRSAAGERP